MSRCARRGFTLVELVTVIMVLGVLAIGTVRFLSDAGNGFAATISRGELAADARAGLDRLTREIREALPNSVRVNGTGQCLEVIPVLGGSTYVTAPLGAPATSMQAVPFPTMTLGTRVAIPVQGNPYQLSAAGAVSPLVTMTGPGAGNELTLQFAASHRFPAASSSQRFFMVDTPVSYCVDGGSLWRYTGYGYSAAQPSVGGLPSALPGRTLVARDVQGSAPYFEVSGATLTRNAMVAVNLDFTSEGDSVDIASLVHMKNVP